MAENKKQGKKGQQGQQEQQAKKTKKPGFLRKLVTKTILLVFILALSIALAGVGHFAYKNDRMPNTKEDCWTIVGTLTQVFDESKKIAKIRIAELEKKWKLEEKAGKISKNWDQMIKQYEDTFDSSKGEDEDQKLLRKKISEVDPERIHKKKKVSTKKTSTTPENTGTTPSTAPGEGKKTQPENPVSNPPVTKKGPENPSTTSDPTSTTQTNPSPADPKTTSPPKKEEKAHPAENSDQRRVLALLKQGTREFQTGRSFYRQSYQTNDSKQLKKAQEHFRKSLAYLEEARTLEKDSKKRETIEELITLTGSHIADCVRMGKM